MKENQVRTILSVDWGDEVRETGITVDLTHSTVIGGRRFETWQIPAPRWAAALRRVGVFTTRGCYADEAQIAGFVRDGGINGTVFVRPTEGQGDERE